MQKVVKNGFKLDLRIHTFFITFSNRNIFSCFSEAQHKQFCL